MSKGRPLVIATVLLALLTLSLLNGMMPSSCSVDASGTKRTFGKKFAKRLDEASATYQSMELQKTNNVAAGNNRTEPEIPHPFTNYYIQMIREISRNQDNYNYIRITGMLDIFGDYGDDGEPEDDEEEHDIVIDERESLTIIATNSTTLLHLAPYTYTYTVGQIANSFLFGVVTLNTTNCKEIAKIADGPYANRSLEEQERTFTEIFLKKIYRDSIWATRQRNYGFFICMEKNTYYLANYLLNDTYFEESRLQTYLTASRTLLCCTEDRCIDQDVDTTVRISQYLLYVLRIFLIFAVIIWLLRRYEYFHNPERENHIVMTTYSTPPFWILIMFPFLKNTLTYFRSYVVASIIFLHILVYALCALHALTPTIFPVDYGIEEIQLLYFFQRNVFHWQTLIFFPIMIFVNIITIILKMRMSRKEITTILPNHYNNPFYWRYGCKAIEIIICIILGLFIGFFANVLAIYTNLLMGDSPLIINISITFCSLSIIIYLAVQKTIDFSSVRAEWCANLFSLLYQKVSKKIPSANTNDDNDGEIASDDGNENNMELPVTAVETQTSEENNASTSTEYYLMETPEDGLTSKDESRTTKKRVYHRVDGHPLGQYATYLLFYSIPTKLFESLWIFNFGYLTFVASIVISRVIWSIFQYFMMNPSQASFAAYGLTIVGTFYKFVNEFDKPFNKVKQIMLKNGTASTWESGEEWRDYVLSLTEKEVGEFNNRLRTRVPHFVWITWKEFLFACQRGGTNYFVLRALLNFFVTVVVVCIFFMATVVFGVQLNSGDTRNITQITSVILVPLLPKIVELLSSGNDLEMNNFDARVSDALTDIFIERCPDNLPSGVKPVCALLIPQKSSVSYPPISSLLENIGVPAQQRDTSKVHLNTVNAQVS